ncbi:MAG: 2-isopropylmalate synthase [Leptolyngbyaceae cyanobacterium CSU_1_4]|nr:2-isopropylmalate synthase [Leptolyngbyaceae cyanobacterium CSU_1_4]
MDLPDRTWPSQTLNHPPIWLSTDLRDGNQALIEPMNVQQKLRLFQLLINIGFQEIEVGFPSASQTDFDFVRSLITENLIPDHVTLQVLTPAREALIRRTFESLQGAKRAIVHLYNATCPTFRRIVFRLDQAETVALATAAARLCQELATQQPETIWHFEYSPETFTATELDFAKTICDAVLEVWQPTPQHKAIINLPATVEVATPNIFADQVEWMHRHLVRRDAVVLSVHPHNDRGCGIAAAELAQMAGADRVEGCLFGNGERTGNVDLVTLALNLYIQGIHPGLDFSDINAVARVVEDCTQIPVHPRHPYVGDLVFTAFSGSHQDAIKKGLAVQQVGVWEVPYLPLDPADVGRSYESVIRVNSQSGKGGIAFLLERDYHLVLPRRLQIEFSQVVQRAMDHHGQEMDAASLWQLFEQEYMPSAPFQYLSHRLLEVERNVQAIAVMLQINGQPKLMNGEGNGLIDAFLDALQLGIRIDHYEERSLSQGSDAAAIAYIEISSDDFRGSIYGVGIHSNIITASLLAVFKRRESGFEA